MNEKSIFNTARKIADDYARDEYLQLACGDDVDALKRIHELLAEHNTESGFLEFPPAGFDVTQSVSKASEPIDSQIGPYKVLQEIGEGGMGSVYMAQQEKPVKRRVALKVIKAGMDSKQVIARFEAERQALAMMDHPNIAHLFDVGTTDTGRPYFVMELVKGIPITEYCDQRHLNLNQRLKLFSSVCNAVQHAHQKGIIHRDLKPNNILVAEFDDAVVPKIIDFGLAKALGHNLTDKTMFTQLGQVVGTLAYMSPEQSKMNAFDVDTRTDIYSLGVLLYELLTGTTPIDKKRLRSAAIDQVLKIIREDNPPKPSLRLSTVDSKPEIAANRSTAAKKISGLVRGELDWVVMKALEKDRTRRYETANGLAAEIQRYLTGEPVLAAPPSVMYRLSKFARRNKVALATMSLVAASLLLGIVGTTWQWFRAEESAVYARIAEQDAVWAKDDAENKSKQLKANSDQLAKNLRVSTARDLAGQAISVRDTYPIRSLLLSIEAAKVTTEFGEPIVPRALESLLNMAAIIGGKPLNGHGEDARVRSMVSPDGRWLVTSAGKEARLWDLNAIDPTSSSVVLQHQNEISISKFSENSRWLVTNERGKPQQQSTLTTRVWDLHEDNPSTSPRLLRSSDGASLITRSEIDPSGRWVATNESMEPDYKLDQPFKTVHKLWDLSAQTPMFKILDSNSGGSFKTFDATGRWLVVKQRNRVSFYDLVKDKTLANPTIYKSKTEFATWSRSEAQSKDGRWFAVATKGNKVLLWDLEDIANSLQPIELLLDGARVAFAAIGFSPDNRLLVSGDGNSAKVWNLDAVDPAATPRTLTGHQDNIHVVAVSHDGKWLATDSYDKTVRIWDLASDNPAESSVVLPGYGKDTAGVEFSSDDRWIAIGGDKTIRLWQLENIAKQNSDPFVLRGHDSNVSTIRFTANNQWLISTAFENSVQRLWDLSARNPSSEREISTNAGLVAITTDSHYLVTSGRDMNVWDIRNTRDGPIHVAELPAAIGATNPGIGQTTSIAISPEGSWMAATADNNNVNVWNLKNNKPFDSMQTLVHENLPNDERIDAIALSPNGRKLVAGSNSFFSSSGSAWIWTPIAEGQNAKKMSLPGQSGGVHKIGFDRKGRWLLTFGLNATLIWKNSPDGLKKLPEVLSNPGQPFLISPDGKWVVIADEQGSARVFNLEGEFPANTHDLTHLPRSSGGTYVRPVAWSHDSRWLFINGGRLVYVWDFANSNRSKPTYVLRGHQQSLVVADVSADDRWLFTGGSDGTARLWDLTAPDPGTTSVLLRGLDGEIITGGFSPDCRFLFTNAKNGTRLWDLNIDSLMQRAKRLSGRELSSDEKIMYLPDYVSSVR